jgi:hypothetical protein
LSADEIRAAAEVHRELGTEYSDAVLESFLARIDSEIGARVDAHVSGNSQVRAHAPDPAKLAKRRAFAGGAAAGALVAGVPLTVFAYSMADGLGRSGWLVGIWLVVALVLGLAGVTLLPRRQ